MKLPKAQIEQWVNKTLVGELRVYWIPQIPMKPFYCTVRTLQEARLLTNTLAAYDAFQFENNIKPDYCSAGGLQVFSSNAGDGEADWVDWYDSEGRSIDELADSELSTAIWEEGGKV